MEVKANVFLNINLMIFQVFSDDAVIVCTISLIIFCGLIFYLKSRNSNYSLKKFIDIIVEIWGVFCMTKSSIGTVIISNFFNMIFFYFDMEATWNMSHCLHYKNLRWKILPNKIFCNWTKSRNLPKNIEDFWMQIFLVLKFLGLEVFKNVIFYFGTFLENGNFCQKQQFSQTVVDFMNINFLKNNDREKCHRQVSCFSIMPKH